jgi:hypothetical protein
MRVNATKWFFIMQGKYEQCVSLLNELKLMKVEDKSNPSKEFTEKLTALCRIANKDEGIDKALTAKQMQKIIEEAKLTDDLLQALVIAGFEAELQEGPDPKGRFCTNTSFSKYLLIEQYKRTEVSKKFVKSFLEQNSMTTSASINNLFKLATTIPDQMQLTYQKLGEFLDKNKATINHATKDSVFSFGCVFINLTTEFTDPPNQGTKSADLQMLIKLEQGYGLSSVPSKIPQVIQRYPHIKLLIEERKHWPDVKKEVEANKDENKIHEKSTKIGSVLSSAFKTVKKGGEGLLSKIFGDKPKDEQGEVSTVKIAEVTKNQSPQEQPKNRNRSNAVTGMPPASKDKWQTANPSSKSSAQSYGSGSTHGVPTGKGGGGRV